MNTSLTPIEPQAEPAGFSSLNLSDEVRRALEEIGYTQPTPVQEATYPLAIEGRDIIVQARTGTGKTAAFGIPLVDKIVTSDPHVQALVLAPTRELALQSQREIARIGQYKQVQTTAVYGGAPMGKQVDDLRGGAQIVSGTPGRVLDHLKRGTLDASRLRVLILDEMDEMLSMGFAKELNAILELIPSREKRQTMCFSATVDGEVRRHAERHMNNPEMVSLSSDGAAASSISHAVYMTSGGDRAGYLVRILEIEDPESAIIFCNMRSETERVAGALKLAGFDADWLNGDLPQKDRERIMGATREGKLRYLVATDVAARGIDISHLTHVINYTFPESAAVYVHRTGRTGRAGRTGAAISLVSPDELGRLYYLRLEYKISPDERSLPTSGELKTRQEIDRIGLLETAFAESPAANDLAIARRLLTHPRIEPILAGLIHTVLGTHEQVDEEAAAARRSRRPTATELPEPEPRRSEARHDRHERQDRPARPERERERERPLSSAQRDRPDRPQQSDRQDRSDRGPRPEREARSERAPRPERETRSERPARSERPDRPQHLSPSNGQDAVQDQADAAAADGGNSTARHSGILYLNLGKRDGVHAGDVARLLRESCASLEGGDIGRIRIRDRYTFVDVPEGALDTIIGKLSGQTLHDKALAPERAKAART